MIGKTHIVTELLQGNAGVSVTVKCLEDKEAAAEIYLVNRKTVKSMQLAEGSELCPEDVKILADDAELCRAEARTVRILSYSDHSELALQRKLMSYGFAEEIAKIAAEKAVENGLVREEEQARQCVDYFLRHKFWGKKRIAMELISRGYKREAIHSAIEATDDDVFVQTAVKLIGKKYPEKPKEKTERDKMISALSRMGYSIPEIKRAIDSAYGD